MTALTDHLAPPEKCYVNCLLLFLPILSICVTKFYKFLLLNSDIDKICTALNADENMKYIYSVFVFIFSLPFKGLKSDRIWRLH